MEASQDSILDLLLFLKSINNLTILVISNIKLFVDDTFIFSSVNDTYKSTNDFTKAIEVVSKWQNQ